MFYRLIFFSLLIVFVSYRDKVDELVPVIPYYNLTEQSDSLFAPQALYCSEKKTIPGLKTLDNDSPLITGPEKTRLLSLFRKITGNISENTYLAYTGAYCISSKQKYHFIYAKVSDSVQYVFVISEYGNRIKSVIMGDYQLIVPMSDTMSAYVSYLSSHKCIIKASSEFYDIQGVEKECYHLSIKNGSVIRCRYKHIGTSNKSLRNAVLYLD